MSEKLVSPVYCIATVIATFIFMVGYSDSSSGESEMSNLKYEIIRAEISGHNFDIPLRYMYGEAREKWGQWPKANKGRVKIDGVHLSMLLPDMKPYFVEDDARWKVLGHGERVEVVIRKRKESAGWFSWLINNVQESVIKGQYIQEKTDRYGLIYFSSATGSRYFSKDGRNLTIFCSNAKVVSPGCRIKSDYRDGIVLEYYYGQNHLPQWQIIDDNLKSLLDNFSASVKIELGK